MPDIHGFTHEVHLGGVYHRCIEEGCDYPGWGVTLPEKERERHALTHRRAREQRIAKERRQNLKKGVKQKKQLEQENLLAYGQEE